MSTNDFVNDLEFGVSNDDLAIKIVTIADQEVLLKDDEFINPYFVSISANPELDLLDEKKLYATYKRVLILCMRKNYTDPALCVDAETIFDPIMTPSGMEKLAKYFTLISCPIKILYSSNQYKKAVRVERKYLSHFNHDNLALENDEIVLGMFELKEDMAKLHVSLYDGYNSVKEIPHVLSLNNYYNDYRARTQKQLSKMILNIKESDYWTNSHNCNITMTNQFLERSFQWKDIASDKVKNQIIHKSKDGGQDDVLNVINRLSEKSEKTSYNLSTVYKPDSFVDISNVLKSQQKRSYFATVDNNNLNITRQQVTQLFESLTCERDMYDLFNTLLISKEYCHMVLNNSQVLAKMKPLIAKFMPLYKYLFGYAWTAFCIEECLFKTKSTKDSRYVFDIKTANLLPTFPFCSDDVYQNPYLTFLVSEKVSDVANNCMALPMFEDHVGYGIDTLERFKWKFNLFTTGNPEKNIFDGLVWDKYAVSGSIIPAFTSIKSPLFDLVANKNDPEYKQWLTYFGHYYSDSDIDFMCNDESVFEFMDSIYNVKNLVEKNLSTENEKVKVDVEPIRTTTFVVNGQYLSEKIVEMREYMCKPELTVESILQNINSSEIKEYFFSIYSDTKRKNNRAQRSALRDKVNPMYEDYFKPAPIDDVNIVIVNYEVDKDSTVAKDSETCVYLNDIRDENNKVPSEKNIMLLKIAENIKFKLRSDKMLHCIEAFRVKSQDFFSVVGRFHLPCVRGYYNGDNVYLLSECVTALMTGINVDYKYFAGVRDPIDILNKYRMRGFGTILNSTEKNHMSYYNGSVSKWNKMFACDAKNKESVKKLFGFKDLNHDMFKPGQFIKGFPADIFNKPERKQIKSIDDLKKYYKAKYGYDPEKSGLDLFKFKTICQDGTIRPLNKWIINACWDLFN